MDAVLINTTNEKALVEDIPLMSDSHIAKVIKVEEYQKHSVERHSVLDRDGLYRYRFFVTSVKQISRKTKGLRENEKINELKTVKFVLFHSNRSVSA